MSAEMYLIQLRLPLHDNDNQAFPSEYFDVVRRTLTERFGGVTAFLRSPAVGLWKEGEEELKHDEVVMFEVITRELDRDWWTGTPCLGLKHYKALSLHPHAESASQLSASALLLVKSLPNPSEMNAAGRRVRTKSISLDSHLQ
jgi:hypothetical protein